MIETARLHAVQCVLFDLDGTLVDTAPDFIAAINSLRQEAGLESCPSDLIRQQVSNGSKVLSELFLADLPGELEQNRQRLLREYQAVNGKYGRLFVGFKSFLSFLHHQDIQWGIVTNKPFEYAKPLLIRLGLYKNCKVLICPDHVSQSKPSPEGLFLAADHLGLQASHCAYVGDHARDIQAGLAAGMPTIAAAYGYHMGDVDSWGADYTVQSATEFKALFKKETMHG